MIVHCSMYTYIGHMHLDKIILVKGHDFVQLYSLSYNQCASLLCKSP